MNLTSYNFASFFWSALLVFSIMLLGCHDSYQKKETKNATDAIQAEKRNTSLKDADESKDKNCFAKFFPFQKLSIKEIDSLLKGNWIQQNNDTIDGDTTRNVIETYTDKKRIVKYIKNLSGNKSDMRNYFLSVKCPPDSILDWGFDEHEHFPCLCYMLLETDSTKKRLGCMALLRITKDSFYITDGEDTYGYISYIRVK